MSWLDVPVRLLRVLATRMARVAAVRTYREANATALGSGTLADGDRRNLVAMLDRDLGGAQQSAKQSAKQIANALAGMGFDVVEHRG